MVPLSRAARLVAWGNAALFGMVSLDDATMHVVGPDDPPHRVTGLPAEPAPVGISLALGRLRALGVTRLRLALPTPGDPQGLPGPPGVNEAAVALGEAVLTRDGPAFALLPTARATWTAYAVAPSSPAVLSVAEAERALTEELGAAAESLTRLDVARWDPAAEDLLSAGRAAAEPLLPACFPTRAHTLLLTAQRIGAVAELADRHEGGAVSGPEVVLRSAALRRLAAASRRAVEAACNAPLPGQDGPSADR
ncbi:MAG: hypothetical protein QOJ90_2162 [Actinomycetota bacterium]|jgi:hypothetical protein|nr:hypothetical protein [Actinomycetota bacterium]